MATDSAYIDKDELNPSDWNIFADSEYDVIFRINVKDQSVKFLYYSKFFSAAGINRESVSRYDSLIRTISDRLSVDEEKIPLIEQTVISNVLYEMRDTNVFVRTFHINTDDGYRAKSLKIFRYDNRDELVATIMDIEIIQDHDWMTDEYSREGFIRYARQRLKKLDIADGYSLCYANVKNFKALNNLLGSKKGDIIIFKELDALKDELHPVIIGRFEADHFVLITEDKNLTDENISRVTTRIYRDESREYTFNIRLGIYHITDKNMSITHMIDNAKLAENSIPLGRKQLVGIYGQDLNDNYVNKQVLIQDLDTAISDSDLIPYFQPVIDTHTKKIRSAEALVRWNHPEMGFLTPNRFIPVFEENGDISKITRYMIDSVIDFNQRRVAEGLAAVPCAVNLSRIDFYDRSLMNYMCDRFSSIDNISKVIKVEVTESAYAVLEADGIELLNELKKIGIMILLDDFGSGMSSLSTLESFEFDTIKLDMGFINKIGKSRTAETIIRSTIKMAHGLNALTVAEGVERQEQSDFLEDAGCDMMQGFLYYRPMPEDKFSEILR